MKLLYNSDYLYFGIRCYDSEPDKIIAYQLNRDVSLRSDDYVNIVIDTFNNYRSGYFFMINPRGSRSDGFIDKRSSTGHPSRDWDGIWEGEAFLDDKGWTAEIALPTRLFHLIPPATHGVSILRGRLSVRTNVSDGTTLQEMTRFIR